VLPHPAPEATIRDHFPLAGWLQRSASVARRASPRLVGSGHHAVPIAG
jgi:hypothetical protein